MTETIVVTGGTGKTGRRLVAALVEDGRPVRVASRSGRGIAGAPGVRFDWLAPSTYRDALRDARAVYLLAPSGVTEPLPVMRPLIEQAAAQDVERFVLLSSSMIEEGGPFMGGVHAYLKAHTREWAVLRPSWFMQNFSEQHHLSTIQEEGRIYSATGEGRVAFVDAGDIARTAARALTGPAPNRDLILTGPRALSYREVAEVLSEITARRVQHVSLSLEQLAERFVGLGMDRGYAERLAAMDEAIAEGAENRTTDEIERVTGRPPIDFREFVRDAIAQGGVTWQPTVATVSCA